MHVVFGDLWTWPADACCVTANGVRRRDGSAVMGAGTARQAAERYPNLPTELGAHLERHGNTPAVFATPTRFIVTFPTKHHWRAAADLRLIASSARRLLALTDAYGWRTVVLPRPGVGLGGLNWPQVRAVLEDPLDDRFHVIAPAARPPAYAGIAIAAHRRRFWR